MKFRIQTPLIKMSKAEIIRSAIALGVDLRSTHSCYDPDENGRPCGRCDSCILRRKGFEEAGIQDPVGER
jgi:7-cyano-7-deazaguanine synthase